MERLLPVLLIVGSMLVGCVKSKELAVDDVADPQSAKADSLSPSSAAPSRVAPPSEVLLTARLSTDEVAAVITSMGGDAVRDVGSPSQPIVSIGFYRFHPSQTTHLDLHRLTELPLQELGSLEIVDVPATEAALADFKCFPSLTSLTLTGSSFTDRGFENVAGLDELVHLSFTGTGLTAKGMAHFPALKKLESLDLSRNKGITDEGLVHLRELDALKELHLDGTSITDAGLKDLTALSKLELLSLNQTRVTDAGVMHILSLRKLATLQLLETPVTAVGLSPLKQLKSLQSLNHSHSAVAAYEEPEVEAPTSKQANRLQEVVSWLPTSTETIMVARGPFTLSEPNGETHQSIADFLRERLASPSVLELRGRKYATELETAQLGLAVEGSRHFHPPTALGGFLFEGCRIFIFEDEFAPIGDRLFGRLLRDATMTQDLDGHKIARFDGQYEQDTVTLFVARPEPNVILEATDSTYLAETLARMKRKQAARSSLLALPVWNILDQRARFCMIRVYDKSPGDDITSPYFEGSRTADPKAKALAFAYPTETTQDPIVLYFSDSDNAPSIAQKSWSEKARCEQRDEQVVAIHYRIENVDDLLAFVQLLLWHFGHGVHI